MNFPKKYYLLLILLTLLVLFVIAYTDGYLKNTVANGIIDFELAGSFDRSQQILQSWNPVAKIYAGFNLGIDFLFLILYTLFFVITVYKLTGNTFVLWQKIKLPVILIFLLAGLFDAVENYYLIRILTGDQQSFLPVYATFFSIGKFLFLLIGIAYLSIAWLYKFIGKPH
jgi:hypothetical protein